MDAAGEGSSKTARRRQERGKTAAKKCAAHPRKRTPVSQLISQLRETVFPNSDTQATKRQVLRQTKNYIQELESTLDTLLKMRDHFHSEERSPSSLEDVKEEYLRIYYSDQSSLPVTEDNSEYEKNHKIILEEVKSEYTLSSTSSSPDLMEFERYLHFYKQTVDMLVENVVVSSEQITHPVVSKAISNLWQDLVQEGKTDMYQRCIQLARRPDCLLPCPKDTSYTEVCVRDSGAESQEGTSSFVSSTPEEILFEDAYDVAAGFIDQGNIQSMSSPSSAYGSSPWESPESDSLLYQQIVGFLRSCICSYAQEASLQCDYETVLLRCTETFDDEDEDL
ncbi:stimulated by retinoic acid gene 8 protein homolog [Discoglossus pictus]